MDWKCCSRFLHILFLLCNRNLDISCILSFIIFYSTTFSILFFYLDHLSPAYVTILTMTNGDHGGTKHILFPTHSRELKIHFGSWVPRRCQDPQAIRCSHQYRTWTQENDTNAAGCRCCRATTADDGLFYIADVLQYLA